MAQTPGTTIPGRFLVQRRQQQRTTATTRRRSHDEASDDPSGGLYKYHPLLVSDVGLSFWGGIDPRTGIVIDASHPLAGQCVSHSILCLPSGRGSCTASQVLLELILNDKAPAAIVLRDPDGLVGVGAIVAQEIFGHAAIDIVQCGSLWEETLPKLLSETCTRNTNSKNAVKGRVLSNGQLQLLRADDAGGSDAADKDDGDEQDVYDVKGVTVNAHLLDPDASFTTEEERMLQECETQAERMALRVIFRYASISRPTTTSDNNDDDDNDNEPTRRYLPIAQSHIDGCTYIGPGGLEFVRRLVQAGGRVKVPTTLNSVSTDRRRWRELGLPAAYAQNSVALGDAYLQLGCQPSFTCAPYLLQHNPQPRLDQHVAWGESNAVVFGNSVLGARTEKYADYLDICCALAGIVPAAGVHLTPHRRPTVLLDARSMVKELMLLEKEEEQQSSGGLDLDLLFPVLGHLCGSLSDGRVPLLWGLEPWKGSITQDHLKAFCAAFGTTAASPLIHIAGITPEATDPFVVEAFVAECGGVVKDADGGKKKAVRQITLEQVQDTFELLDGAASRRGNNTTTTTKNDDDCSVDLVALGNPHLSVSECRDLAALIMRSNNDNDDTSNSGVGGKQLAAAAAAAGAAVVQKKHPDTRIIACMSRAVHAQADASHRLVMEQFGVEFVFDTCWCMLLDAPIIPANPQATIMTNSGKYSHYGPGLTQRNFRMGSMADCIRAAASGVYPSRRGGARGGRSGGGHFLATAQRRHYTTSSSASLAWRSTVSSILRRRWR